MCLTSISALRGPAQCYDCQLWLAPARPCLGWCWLRFIPGSTAKFSPPALLARNNVIRWVITPSISCCLEFKEIDKKKIHIDSVFVGFFFVIIVFKVSLSSHSSRVTSWKSSLAHCVCLIAPAPSCNMLAYPNKMKNQYMSPISPIFCRTIDPDTMISQCDWYYFH